MKRRDRNGLISLGLVAAMAGAFLAVTVATGSAEPQGERLDRGRSYPQSRVEMRPPGQSDQERVSAHDARVAAERHDGRPEGRKGEAARIYLARVDDNELAVQRTPGDAPERIIMNRLVWAIITPNVPVVIYGGMETPSDGSPSRQWACDYVQLVDATTGVYLEAVQAC